MSGLTPIRLRLALVLIAALSVVGCGSVSSPSSPSATPKQTLLALTIEPSPSCAAGATGPFSSYLVIMRDKRSGSATWAFAENRDPQGAREQVMTLQLEGGGPTFTGWLQGPAIITTALGRMTVSATPLGVPLSAVQQGSEVKGTWPGHFGTWMLDGSKSYPGCEAADHRFTLALPAER